MTNKRFHKLALSTLFLGFAALILPAAADAQGQLRYQTRYSKADVSRIISKLESSSDTFRRDFDRAMDNSPYNGTNAEDRYNDNVGNYEDSLDRLRREFDRSNSWWEARNDVSDVVRRAQVVNDMMNSISFRRNLERQWSNMRNDLNVLADTFDLPGLNGGGWTGGGGWGTGQTSTPPSWAQGTFYGTAPDGTRITLTISGNGQVTAVLNGMTNYGTYYRENITMNGAVSRLTQWGNGVRTTRRDNGEVINYTRNNWGGGDGGWGNIGQTSTPPTWAQGSFFGTAYDGTQITLTIDRTGRVTAQMNGTSVYGSYYRGNITIGGATSRVTQWGDGLRTTRNDNGEIINYSRSGFGGGNWGGGGTPVSWAIGSFVGRNPVTGGNIYLTINGNGQVTVNMDGNMTYGSMNGSALTINGITSTVTRNGNGIRTTRNDNGERINYRRQ